MRVWFCAQSIQPSMAKSSLIAQDLECRPHSINVPFTKRTAADRSALSPSKLIFESNKVGFLREQKKRQINDRLSFPVVKNQ